MSEDYINNEEEEEEEVFDLENLLEFLEKNNYQTTSVFTYEKRVVFLFITEKYNGNELFLYIPSSHTIQLKDKLKDINILKLIEIEDSEDIENKNNLFKNTDQLKNIEIRLERFLPVLEEESFKLCYIENKNMIFVNRHNSIDKFNLSNNIDDQKKGIYLMTDLEYFSENYKNIDKNINDFEKKINSTLSHPVNNILKDYNNIIKNIDNLLKKNNNINSIIDKYNERKQKLDEISLKIKSSLKDTNKQKEELKNMKSQLRKEHLNFLYVIENICNSFKNLKDTI
jgi:hypothetical protein